MCCGEGDERVGEDEFGLADVGAVEGDGFAGFDFEPGCLGRRVDDGAGIALAAVFVREIQFDAGFEAGVAEPVLGAGEGAVDAGGADFQGPGGGDGVFDVQDGGEEVADLLAVLDGEGGAVGAVGHDLDGGGFLAHDLDADELVALVFEPGGDQVGDFGFEAGVDGLVVGGQGGKNPIKKAARLGPPWEGGGLLERILGGFGGGGKVGVV